MIGICSYGGYVPRYRLKRGKIYDAWGWLNPVIAINAMGEKAIANADEDSITMAVSAGIDALKNANSSTVEGVYFASTTMPYKERVNAGIIALAFGLDEHVRTVDFSGGLTAGTGALLSALEGVKSKMLNNILVTASDCRLGKPASTQEMIFGDAAAAFLIGDKDVIAEYKGACSVSHDFVDHFRGEFGKYDKQWEDRWIRDMGYGRFIPQAVNLLCDKYQVKVSDFAAIIYPCHYPAARRKINKVLGVAPESERRHLQAEMGDSGTPHALVMLAHAFEKSKPGDKILMVSYGNGCHALFFEVTENIKAMKNKNSVSECLANRADLDNYLKYLVWRDILRPDMGLKGEESDRLRWSAMWRYRKEVLGLWGSKCKECGTPQFPKQRVCANPECNALDKMEDYRFSDKIVHLKGYTGDMLTSSIDPPAIYGDFDFEGGGKAQFDMTDCDLEEVSSGKSFRLSFRIHKCDRDKGITEYFWKAVPLKGGNNDG